MPGKTIAILQSNYIPWKGYFDLIHSVDEFVLYDDVQYTKRDWRNRNKIKGPNGTLWLTIPVKVKGRYLQTIRETEIDGVAWARSHWQSIQQFYGKAPYFTDYEEVLSDLFLSDLPNDLSTVNRIFLEALCRAMNISTPISSSITYDLEGKKPTEKLILICKGAGATTYVSGPAAKAYLDEEAFAREGISVKWFSYEGYPEYPQPYPPFRHDVSLIDLLLNTGSQARNYMLSFERNYAKPQIENHSLRC